LFNSCFIFVTWEAKPAISKNRLKHKSGNVRVSGVGVALH